MTHDMDTPKMGETCWNQAQGGQNMIHFCMICVSRSLHWCGLEPPGGTSRTFHAQITIKGC